MTTTTNIDSLLLSVAKAVAVSTPGRQANGHRIDAVSGATRRDSALRPCPSWPSWPLTAARTAGVPRLAAGQAADAAPSVERQVRSWGRHAARSRGRSTRAVRTLTAVLLAAAIMASSAGAAAGQRPPTATSDRHGASASQAIAVTARVPMGAGPTGIGYGHGLLWVTRDNDTVASVDPASGRILASTHVGRFPVAVAVGSRSAWVADSAGDRVSEVDLHTGRLRRTIAVGDQPAGIALTAGAVWVVCTGDGRVFRIDPTTGRVVARIPLGPPPDDIAAIAAGPSGLWVTSLDRVVHVSPQTNTVATAVPVTAPTDVSVGPHAVWVASMQQRRVTRIDPRSDAVSGSFHVGHGPSGVALALHRLWVLDNTDSTVSELDPRSGRTLARVAIGPHSYDIAAGGAAVWAQSYGDQALYKIQPSDPVTTG
jgi:DNA-binding beta-propeller fold protein YncE